MLSAEPTQEQAEASALVQRQAKRARLLAAFEELQQLNPYRSISDPVAWQREQREDRLLLGRE